MDIFGKTLSDTLGIAGSPSTLQEKESSTEAAIRDHMEDTGTGTEGAETGKTQTDRLTEAAQNKVSGELDTLGG